MARDLTQGQLAAIEILEAEQPIEYGVRLLEIRYEAGKRVHTRRVVDESFPEKFRTHARRTDPGS